MLDDLIARLAAALDFDAQNGTDAQWSNLLAEAHNALPALEALRAERDALREKENDAFKAGYLIAVANITNLHDEDVIAEDVLSELGESEGVIRRLQLTDYDAKPLRRLFREISRKRKITRARKALGD